MKMRTLFIVVICLIIALGLFSGIFAQSIQRLLTIMPPAVQAMQQGTGKMNNGTTTPIATPGTTPGTTPLAPTVVAQMPGTVTMLAQDTFQRTDQALWGTASDGRTWEGDANNQNVANSFAIKGGMGVITNTQGTLNALLGPINGDMEVLASATVSQFDAPNINFGVVLRWNDNNNWYKALIDGNNLTILSRVNGVTTQLGNIHFAAQAGTAYSIRFRAIGSTLFAKVWASNTTEPTNWMLTLMDTALTTGHGGVRVLLVKNITVQVSSFVETMVNGLM